MTNEEAAAKRYAKKHWSPEARSLAIEAHLAGQSLGREQAVRWGKYPEEKPGIWEIGQYICWDGNDVMTYWWNGQEWEYDGGVAETEPEQDGIKIQAWMPLPTPPDNKEDKG